jgi:hypothetical protein
MNTTLCKYCGKEFAIKYKHKKGNIIQEYCCVDCGNKSRRTRKFVPCLSCGKLFETTRAKCCSNKCAIENKKKTGIMRRNGHWNENGYRVLYIDGDKSIKEHIYIMEMHVGRKLSKNEIVHHINKNRSDNRIENLILLTKSEHSSLHRKDEISRGVELFGRAKNKKQKAGTEK